ncbi:hypothetical protein [Tautonia marina]|uniref:hypothetical protein n=1 Tax=Tautonia marina TaxID=2653855 RepID=UPI001260EB8C|nr:hypothetical protein [Tautonia marina]
MATSLSQTIANRLNALLSTGPKSREGKARSSRNAQTHGLSKLGSRPPAEMAEAISERTDQWRGDYRPEGPAQQWLFEQLVAESVRLDTCVARICAARAEQADRAVESWDDDRAAAIATLAARLLHHPDRIQPQLLQTRHGVLWLLDRWAEITEAITQADGWTRDTWHRALDLLGVPPSARDGSGPWDLHPEDSSAAPGLDLIHQATAALRSRLETYLNARDDRAQADAALGLATDDPPALRLLERYAVDARRQFSRHLNELRRLQSLAPHDAPTASRSTPSHPPGPRPDRLRPRAESSSPLSEPHSTPTLSPTEPTPPARNEPKSGSSLRPVSILATLPGASAPLNRRARRALAAAARRS